MESTEQVFRKNNLIRFLDIVDGDFSGVIDEFTLERKLPERMKKCFKPIKPK